MMNMQAILKQAQMMQKKMEETQSKLAAEEVFGTSGGGLVEVVLNGKFELKKIHIDPSLLADGDAQMLEDMIVAAHLQAYKKADEKMSAGMKDVTGGMNLGGLKLPF